MTLSGTIRYIERIALMQPSVKMVVPNDIFRLNATPEAEYAVFGWTQGQHSIGADDSYATYSFTFFYVDRLTEDKGNQLEIQSVGITVLDNIIRTIIQAGVQVAGSYTFTSFNQRFVDECAGVFCAISLRVPLDSLCEDTYFDFNDDFNDDYASGGLQRDSYRGGVLGPDRDYAAPNADDFYPRGGGSPASGGGPGGGGTIVVNIPVKDVTLDGESVVVDKVAVLPAYPQTLAELLPDEDHNVVTEGQIEVWNGKQDEISDLDEIRAGAEAGETAYQKPANGIPASDLAPGVIPTVPTDMVKYTAQTLNDAQKQQARTNIGATAPEIFWAKYGVTTAQELSQAVADGKQLFVKDSRYICTYGGNDGNYHYFFAVIGNITYRRLQVQISTNSWARHALGVEGTANKSQSVETDRASTSKYPSVKAVFDLFSTIAYNRINVDTAIATIDAQIGNIYQWTINPSGITINLPNAPTEDERSIILKFATGLGVPTLNMPMNISLETDRIILEPEHTYILKISYDTVGGWVLEKKGFLIATPILPTGYTSYVWIAKTSGKGYIDTNYIPKTKPKAIFSFARVGATVDSDLLGFASATTNAYFTINPGKWSEQLASGAIYYKFGNKSSGSKSVANVVDTWHSVNASDNLIYDGEIMEWATSWDFSQNQNVIKIFGGRNNNCVNFKLKRIKLYDGDTLVRDLIPCTNPNEEPGFYDLITETFYGSAVAGQTFIVGN